MGPRVFTSEYFCVRTTMHDGMQVAAAHGASHADALTIFAAMCPRRMQGKVDVPSTCENAGLPLWVRPPFTLFLADLK